MFRYSIPLFFTEWVRVKSQGEIDSEASRYLVAREKNK